MTNREKYNEKQIAVNKDAHDMLIAIKEKTKMPIKYIIDEMCKEKIRELGIQRN